ncbi:MAG: glycoside hydrolase [Actinobacteria bacterium]|nr:glycoside hydrolase [Actinomycetota bacterium]
MADRRSLVFMLALSFTLVAAACTAPPSTTRARGEVPVDEGLLEELEEQSERTEERLEALEAATSAGTLGLIERVRRQPAPGWDGERIVNATGDDWEPAIAADPNTPYVYILHSRFGGPPACASNCPDPAMILHVSADGGETWQPERYLCVCRRVQWQFDPLIEVVPDTGEVYAVWMNGFNIFFSTSSNHGATWSTPVRVYGNVAWGDKPNFATSADGQDVYVLFNGPTDGDVHAAASHDGGETWSQVRVTDGRRYYFAYGTAVLPQGRVVSTQISFSYSGPAASAEGVVQVHVLTSDDGGATWADAVVDTLELGILCTSEGCYADFYDSGPALAADEDGDLVIVYSGAATPEGPRTVYARSSTDGGTTWGARVPLSPTGVNAAFAAAAGTGDDRVHVYFADQRTGRWNVWYRTSPNLGRTWSAADRISDAVSGTVYKDADGFSEFYGDYGEIAVTSSGGVIAVWPEGESYNGPGGVWYNRRQ